MERRYYFVRHGRPTNEAASFRISGFRRDMLGLVDEALTEEGRRQAREVAATLAGRAVQRVFSSQLRRARQTAEELSAALGAPLAEGLRELNELAPGETWLSATRLPELLTSRQVPGELRRLVGPPLAVALTLHHLAAWRLGWTRGGDEPDEIRERIRRVLALLDDRPEQRLAVTGHGYWILLLAAQLSAGLEQLKLLRWVPHCSVTRVDADGRGRYRLAYFAQRAAT